MNNKIKHASIELSREDIDKISMHLCGYSVVVVHTTKTSKFPSSALAQIFPKSQDAENHFENLRNFRFPD